MSPDLGGNWGNLPIFLLRRLMRLGYLVTFQIILKNNKHYFILKKPLVKKNSKYFSQLVHSQEYRLTYIIINNGSRMNYLSEIYHFLFNLGFFFHVK